MLYQLQQGKTEKTVLDMARRMGEAIPESIKNAPTLLPGLEFYMNAFWTLSTDRNLGMAEGPIPWTAIDRYAIRHDIWGWDFERFEFLIKAMDVTYIEFRSKKFNKDNKTPIGGARPEPPGTAKLRRGR